MADIFISFIHEDEKVADGVKAFLDEKLGINSKVFLASDKWAIYAGENCWKEFKEELASAKVVFLLLSKESISHPWVNFEAGAAWITEKAIIPACFGDLQKGALPKPYSNLQALSLDDFDGPYYLVTSIYHDLKSDRVTPPPSSPRDQHIVGRSGTTFAGTASVVVSFDSERRRRFARKQRNQNDQRNFDPGLHYFFPPRDAAGFCS